MSSHQHFTTRRAFIGTLGFGGVALYGAWAAYGAAPLPFLHRAGEKPVSTAQADIPGGHGGHGGGGMAPDEFMRRHEDFLARFRRPDGSVAVAAQQRAAAAQAGPSAIHGDTPAGGDAHAGHTMPHMMERHGAAMLHNGGDGAAQAARHSDDEPLDIYLLAYRFGFAPDEMHLRAGQPYRLRTMASDIAHGASLQLGRGSRIIRLRPNTVNEQTVTFARPGPVLVYCTVYCGPAHDAMKARILVA